jgi:hypothetical protein
MEDYTLVISWVLSGWLDRVLESPHLPFSRMEPGILPSREAITTRLRLIWKEAQETPGQRPLPVCPTLRSPVEWQKANLQDALTRLEELRFLRALYLYGIPENQASRKLARIAHWGCP